MNISPDISHTTTAAADREMPFRAPLQKPTGKYNIARARVVRYGTKRRSDDTTRVIIAETDDTRAHVHVVVFTADIVTRLLVGRGRSERYT